MPAFYRALLTGFLAASDTELLGVLTLAHAQEFQAQLRDATTTWFADVKRLQTALATLLESTPSAAGWSVLLEFVVPRKDRRIDVVLLAGEQIVLLEGKSGQPTLEDARQLEEYALLLHYFHKPSAQRHILPLLVGEKARTEEPARQQHLALTETAAYWIAPVRKVSWADLPGALHPLARSKASFDAEAWDNGEYHPVPSIIEAARSLQQGLTIREIAHSRAARHDIENLTSYLQGCVTRAREASEFLICFVTGVPGSGKTLVGLNLAFSSRADGDTLNFMSGNGPLVSVLQSLFYDYRLNVDGERSAQARIDARTLIEDVHLFAKAYTQQTPHAIPSNHVVIFDEAQRAWDFEQSYRKFARETSEPEMFLQIMERHRDWAVILALVGGGQEINTGEAGIAEWGRALAAANRKPWRVLASPEVLRGGAAVAGGRLLSDPAASALPVEEEDRLHLAVSVRSLKAENYARWVNSVVEGNAQEAAALQTGEFPVYLTRDLAVLRQSLRNQVVGASRCGLVGSSKAARLRAEGLEPDGTFHGEYPWDRWFLAPSSDVRASSQLEVYATEFEIQGLELDWIGLCWGGDFIWSAGQKRWLSRRFRNADRSGWTMLRNKAEEYRRNSYRVLLTRARQGIILFVPRGDPRDPTRSPQEFEETAAFLVACGVLLIAGDELLAPSEVPAPSLFDSL